MAARAGSSSTSQAASVISWWELITKGKEIYFFFSNPLDDKFAYVTVPKQGEEHYNREGNSLPRGHTDAEEMRWEKKSIEVNVWLL